MKLIFCIVFLFTSVIFFSGSLNDYIYNFDYLNYNKYIDKDLRIINSLLNSLKTGNNRLFNEMYNNYYLELQENEKKIYDVLFSLKAYEYIRPYNEFKQLIEMNPKSIIIKALFVEYAYRNWSANGNPDIIYEIKEVLNDIDEIVGENPFSIYYKAKIFYNSRVFSDNEKANHYLDILVNSYPPNQRIYNLYINMNFQNKNYEKIKEIYPIYKTFNNLNLSELFIFLNTFDFLDDEEAKNLATYITENINVNSFLARAYEVLGDYEDNLKLKKDYYVKAYWNIPLGNINYLYNNIYPISNFSSIHLKAAKTSYEYDPEMYEDFARVALNQGHDLDPNNKEISSLLKEFRGRIRNRVLLKYFLPIGIMVLFGIIFILKWEKGIRINNRGHKKLNKYKI